LIVVLQEMSVSRMAEKNMNAFIAKDKLTANVGRICDGLVIAPCQLITNAEQR
jgi:hypothetical protein